VSRDPLCWERSLTKLLYHTAKLYTTIYLSTHTLSAIVMYVYNIFENFSKNILLIKTTNVTLVNAVNYSSFMLLVMLKIIYHFR